MPTTQPLIGVVLGSASDLDKVQGCMDVLAELGVAHEVIIASAHRTPERAAGYAKSARDRGLKVIIAAAGWAAHLPGVLAAYTTLPVIGLPLSGSPLGGTDSLYAVVQMPPGVPVATVGIDTARNAGILAAEILAIADDALVGRLAAMREDMAAKVIAASDKLETACR